MTSNDRIRSYARAFWAVGFFLMAMPVADLFLRAWPLQVRSMQWRFGFLSLFFTSTGGFLLGFTVVGLAAVLREQRRLLRAMSVIAIVGAVVIVASALLYGLDTLQLRPMAPIEARPLVFRTAASAMFAAALCTITFLALAITGWQASRKAASAPDRKVRVPDSVLVYGAPASRGEPAHTP